jgi:hypothetical protein
LLHRRVRCACRRFQRKTPGAPLGLTGPRSGTTSTTPPGSEESGPRGGAAPTSYPSRPERALDPVHAGRGVGAPGVSGGRRRIDVTAVSARWSFPFCAHACDHGSYLLQTSRSS